MTTTQTPRRTTRNRVLDVKKMLCAATVALSLSLFAGRAAKAQVTTQQEAEGNVVIEINNTSVTTDDVLAQGSLTPLLCNARLVNAQKDMTIVLVVPAISATDSGKRLSFSLSSAVWTTTLLLPKDGTPKSFSICATSNSQAVGDAKIEAHKDTATGELKTTAAATVYWFNNAKMQVDCPGVYNTYGQPLNAPPLSQTVSITPAVGYGANLNASIDLMPSLSIANAPQLAKLRIAVVQNALSYTGYVAQYEAADTTMPFQKAEFIARTSIKSDDVAEGFGGPTYRTPAPLTTRGEFTDDTPGAEVPRAFSTEHGVYNLVSILLNDEFSDWCTIVDTDLAKSYPSNLNAAIISKSQSGWKLNIVSYGPGKSGVPNLLQSRIPSSDMVLTTVVKQFTRELSKPPVNPHYYN